MSPLASLTYDDLAVGMRAWEGHLLFFHFGCLGERTSGLEVWSREVTVDKEESLMKGRGQDTELGAAPRVPVEKTTSLFLCL